MAIITRQFRVRGKVQGVFFRASTQAQAKALGLVGHARNLDDGDVEVLVKGEEDKIQALADWLAIGPEQARVDEVTEQPAGQLAGNAFVVR